MNHQPDKRYKDQFCFYLPEDIGKRYSFIQEHKSALPDKYTNTDVTAPVVNSLWRIPESDQVKYLSVVICFGNINSAENNIFMLIEDRPVFANAVSGIGIVCVAWDYVP